MDDEVVYHHKRQRMSPPLTPNQNKDEEDGMDVVSPGRESRAASDASSDWGDWADKQVAQGEPPGDMTLEAVGEGGAVDSSGTNEDDQWVLQQMEQPSAVLGADNRAWDYVLQQIVLDEREEASEAATVASPVQEIRGAAATEFVSRWLRSNLPIALPSLNALGLIATQTRPGSAGRAVVDSVAAPSAVAVASCSPEQSMHRVNLFSLGANAGSALAAALVQPGAVGLLAAAAASRENAKIEAFSAAITTASELSEARPDGVRAQSRRGVIFESLDSRIHMGSLVSAMGRLGLGARYRSRSGLWRLRPGAVLLPTAESNRAAPLALEDARFVARCCGLPPGGALPTSERVSGAEALVRGLIRRNPSAGIRRGGQLVAWCLSFDNGLAGALHVDQAHPPFPSSSSSPSSLQSVEREGEGGGSSPQDLVLALLASLLIQPSEAKLPIVRDNSNGGSSAPFGVEGGGARVSTTQYQPDILDSSAQRKAGLVAVVIDDESPFVGLFQELDLLERVCDADWVRFDPVAHRASSGSGSRAVVVDGDDNSIGLSAGGPLELPLAALVMQP